MAKKRGRGVSNVVCCKRKCPSSASEGGDRLSKTNEAKFEFITKEVEGWK